LGNSFFGETLFDIEKLLHGSEAKNISTGNHVFVAGLARAGTTILMRKLYENNKFCSLTYRDMPFILAPNTWHIVSNLSIKKTKMQERAHGDGIEVDYDSPEALEEVFWRTFCGADYIKQNYLIPMVAPHETIEKFRSFISIILKNENNKSYLSKNNNNILRLSSIVKAFPNALIIVPFREPLQQAYSLRKQHQRFKHSGGQFTNKYMYWLAHHEFGADHRPFIFDENIEDKTDTENLSYWLRLWTNTYSYILKNRPAQVIFLSYEELCDNTEYIWEKLSEKIELSPYNETISFSKSLNEINEDLPCNILSHATELYEELNSNSIGFSRN
jgi:hypothetical protein